MTTEAQTFGLAGLLTVAGMAVMLWGVSLNNGEAPNAPILGGGAVVLVAIAVITLGIAASEPAHDAE